MIIRLIVHLFTCSALVQSQSEDSDLIFPTSQVALEGNLVYIQCSFAKDKVTWKKDGAIVKGEDLIFRNNVLFIKNVKRSHAGIWTCKGKNNFNNWFKATSELLVGVYDKSNKVYPSPQSVLIGDTTKLYCVSNKNVKWYFMHLTQPPISKSKSLLLKNIQYNNSGEYYCFGSYGDQDTNFVARGVINVFEPNKVVPPSQNVEVGDTVDIRCESFSKPLWSHNGYALPENAKEYGAASLRIVSADIPNKGHYECRGSSANGDLFQSFGIIQIIVKRDDMILEKHKDASVGDKNVEFTCYSRGEVTWLFNSSVLPPDIETGKFHATHQSWLKIGLVKNKHNGIYTCYDLQDYLIHEDEATLRVHGQDAKCPELNIEFGTVVVSGYEEGSTAEYYCQPGYILIGNRVRTCLHDSTWSDTDPICKKTWDDVYLKYGTMSDFVWDAFFETRDISDWYALGIQLGFLESELNRIKRRANNACEAKILMLSKWESEGNPSWDKLIAAVLALGYGIKADDIKKKITISRQYEVVGEKFQINLPELMKLTEKISDWYALGTTLEINKYELKQIQNEYSSDIVKARQEVLKKWLGETSAPHRPSWRLLVRSLYCLGYEEIAGDIYMSHVAPHQTGLHQPANKVVKYLYLTSAIREFMVRTKSINDSFKLGILLNINDSDLIQMHSEFLGDLDRLKIEIIQRWIQSNVNASWICLSDALKEMGHPTVASNLMQINQLPKIKQQGLQVQLNIPFLAKDLKDINEDWYGLGLILGMSQSDLESIRSMNYDKYYMYISLLLVRWIIEDKDASLLKLINALTRIGYGELSERIAVIYEIDSNNEAIPFLENGKVLVYIRDPPTQQNQSFIKLKSNSHIVRDKKFNKEKKRTKTLPMSDKEFKDEMNNILSSICDFNFDAIIDGSSIPSCPSNCPDNIAIKDGQVILNGTQIGSLAQYLCYNDMIMIGNKYRQCLSSGHWSGISPKCTSPHDGSEKLHKLSNLYFVLFYTHAHLSDFLLILQLM